MADDQTNNKPPFTAAGGGTLEDASSDPATYTVEPQSDDYHTGRYGQPDNGPGQSVAETLPALAASEPPPPPPPATSSSDDDDDDGMLRMSFLGHLEELRHRLIQALYGLGVAFILAVAFAQKLWYLVQQPAEAALTSLGYPPELIFTSPMDAVMITWFKLPLLASVFIASPWVLYQAWSFIAPGLYKKERKLAVPFVISTAGLFILGGLFAYFIAFRFGLKFLLGVGQSVNIRPMITITEYFDIFVNVILGVGVVFELPVLIFMLTLLRITTPKFLLANSRYAILGIVIVAAVITPTPDVFNLMLFSLPMVLLYFVGIFASYLLVRSREGLRFPWIRVIGATAFIVLGLGAAGVWYALTKMGYHTISSWPFLTR